MQKAFMILIATVFLLTIFFGILIWRQSIKFEKKALAAKKRKEAYLKELERQEEIERQQELERQVSEAAVEQNSLSEESQPVSAGQKSEI